LGPIEEVLSRAYAPFPAFRLCFKSIMGVVSSEDVEKRLRFHFDRLNCVQMAAYQFNLHSGYVVTLYLVKDGF
jgi:hypothetical protein